MSTKKKIRQIVFFSDDILEAATELTIREQKNNEKLYLAEVRKLIDPPKTAYKFIVFRLIED